MLLLPSLLACAPAPLRADGYLEFDGAPLGSRIYAALECRAGLWVVTLDGQRRSAEARLSRPCDVPAHLEHAGRWLGVAGDGGWLARVHLAPGAWVTLRSGERAPLAPVGACCCRYEAVGNAGWQVWHERQDQRVCAEHGRCAEPAECPSDLAQP